MGKKVLVVDDEKEIADLVEVYLKNDGYEVLKFYNATDALPALCNGRTGTGSGTFGCNVPGHEWLYTLPENP